MYNKTHVYDKLTNIEKVVPLIVSSMLFSYCFANKCLITLWQME